MVCRRQVKGCNVNSVCQMYVDYACRRFHKHTIVFDYHEAGFSRKDVAHRHRSGRTSGTTVKIDGNMLIKLKKEYFLANKEISSCFWNLYGLRGLHCACRMWGQCAYCHNRCEGNKGWHNSDWWRYWYLITLLCYHADHIPSFTIVPEAWSRGNPKQDIHWTQNSLRSNISSSLLFAHARVRCDITSRLFGIGEGVPLQKLIDDQAFRMWQNNSPQLLPRNNRRGGSSLFVWQSEVWWFGQFST